MGPLINRVERREIKPGDHIYTYRAASTYSHHGIFVGENMVVHFTSDKDLNSSSGMSSDSSQYNSRLICSSYTKCGFRKPNSGVVHSCLNCFLKEGSLHRYEYGACPFVFHAHLRGGTCTTAKSDPSEEVIRRASYLLESGFGDYDLLQNNCEDFALYCKNGLLTLDKIKTDIGKTVGSHQKKANKLGVGASGQVSFVSSVFGSLLEAICGFGNYIYDLLQNNCEDFAHYCKMGLLALDEIKTIIDKARGSHQKKANKLGVGASGQVSSVSSFFDSLWEAICGFGNYIYDLLQNNCEGFALYCKICLLTLDKIKTVIGKARGSHQKKANKLGVGASGQVSSVFGAPLEAIFSSCLNLEMPSHVSRAVVKAEENYSLDRYELDIGVRDDVMKVAVEDLAVKLGWEGQHHEEVADDTEASKRDFVALMNSVSIPILDGTNFSEWSEQVQFYLGLWDLDLALRTEKPPTITNSSSAKENARYKFWERSNRLSIMFMRMNMVDNIKSTLSECDNAKELFKTMEERFQSIDESLTRTLMDELTTMKFDGTREIDEHILEMTNIATKLRTLGMNVDELFLVQLILDSLPPQYRVQEETRLEQQRHYSVHHVSQGVKKIEPPKVNGPSQVIEVHEKRQNNVIEPPEINEHPQVIEVHERRQNNVICYFCNEIGHIKKNCHKRKAWFEKRGIPYDPNHKPK